MPLKPGEHIGFGRFDLGAKIYLSFVIAFFMAYFYFWIRWEIKERRLRNGK